MDELEQIREQNRWNPDRKKEDPEKPKSSLPKSTITLMLTTALFFDAVQAILTVFAIGVVISPFISVFAGLTFTTWFLMHGISFISPKRLAAMGGGFLVEVIPAVDVLPAWTAAVWYVISTTKILEKVEKMPGGKVASMVVGSKISSINTARTTAIEESKAGLSTQSANRGNMLYMGAKNPQTTQTSDTKKNINQVAKNPDNKKTDNKPDYKKQIDELKIRIESWKKELQELKPQLSKFEQEDKDYRQYIAGVIKTKKETGISDEELTKLEMLYLNGNNKNRAEESSKRFRANTLKDSIWSGNNKLIELNRKNGTPIPMEISKAA